MATNWLPDLAGFSWTRKRASRWNTLVQTAASGLETRAALMTIPRREWTLPYAYLRENAPYYEVEQLEGFFDNQYGDLLTFFFRDQYENTVTGGYIATGDGVSTSFQGIRFLAAGSIEPGSGVSYSEPVFCFDTRAVYRYPVGGSGTQYAYTRPVAVSPQAYVDTGSGPSPTAATFVNETGVITFGAAPANLSTITADFSYGFRVRFSEDSFEIDNVQGSWNTNDQLKIIETRV
jgi:hypothetical protein